MLLGDAYNVVEEGLNGRTTAFDYSDRVGLNGSVYFGPCMRTHEPVGVAVVMLGTNDLKIEFALTATQIATALDGYLAQIAEMVSFGELTAPQVILVSPAPLDENAPLYSLEDGEFDTSSALTSRELAAAYETVAAQRGVVFVDAAKAARVGADGIHLDAAAHVALARLLAGVMGGLSPL